MPGPGNRTVMESIRYLNFLRFETELLVSESDDPALNEFGTFEPELRLLHRGVIRILNAIYVQPEELAPLGLRINEEAWLNSPETALAGFEEVRAILVNAESWINIENQDIIVTGFDSMFEGHFGHARGLAEELQQADDESDYGSDGTVTPDEGSDFETVEGMASLFNQIIGQFQEIQENNESNSDDLEEGPPIDANNEREEQISQLDAHNATQEDEGQCVICLERILCGQNVRLLQCSHRFHRDCIDEWLRNSATCPIDRSSLFDSV